MTYSIREIARIFGNTVGAIRFYEEAGLVNPQRSESNQRIYTEDNIKELFYLRKYCAYGLAIKETVEYFNDQNTKDIQAVSRLLAEREEEALQQAVYHQKVAGWVRDYNQKLCCLDKYVGTLHPVHPPEYCLLYDEHIVGKGTEKQQLIQKWIAASPLTKISTALTFFDGKVQSKIVGFSSSVENVKDLGLPVPPEIKYIPSVPCFYTIVKIPSTGFDYLEDAHFATLVEQVEEAGFSQEGEIISNIFYTHIQDGVQYKYFELWVPYVEKSS